MVVHEVVKKAEKHVGKGVETDVAMLAADDSESVRLKQLAAIR